MDSPTITASLKHASQLAPVLTNKSDHYHWLSTIPPERRGLHGEYDYYGLSKRVYRCLNTSNVDVTPGRLKVRQRGRVVVLSGHLISPNLLHRIIDLTLSVEGVDAVEAQGVAVVEAYEAC